MGEDVKDQILRATLEMINELGIQKITTREIAKRAGVNSAALHYYFGTKELLVEEALVHMSKHMRDAFSVLEYEGLRPEEKLLRFLHAFVNLAIQYPGIIKSVMASAGKGGPMHSEIIRNMGRGLGILRQLIGELNLSSSERDLTYMAIQLLSSAMYPMLLRKQLVSIGSLDYFDYDTRDEYLRYIVQQLSHLSNPK